MHQLQLLRLGSNRMASQATAAMVVTRASEINRDMDCVSQAMVLQAHLAHPALLDPVDQAAPEAHQDRADLLKFKELKAHQAQAVPEALQDRVDLLKLEELKVHQVQVAPEAHQAHQVQAAQLESEILTRLSVALDAQLALQVLLDPEDLLDHQVQEAHPVLLDLMDLSAREHPMA